MEITKTTITVKDLATGYVNGKKKFARVLIRRKK